MTQTLFPLLAAGVVALAAVAFALYVWTYVRHVALADGPRDRPDRPGRPDRLAFA